ncbi:MAG: M24 family metallopeptidase [Rhodothermales bacterium]
MTPPLTTETAPLTHRHERLEASLRESGLAALALNPGPTLRYLTGLDFHLMERPVVAFFAPDVPPTLVLPELETGKLANLPFDLEAFPYGEDPDVWPSVFQKAIKHAGLDGEQIGVEPLRMRVRELRLLEEVAPEARFVSGEEVVSALRSRKDAAEIGWMREATVVAENALQATLPQLQVGMTERELASELVLQIFRAGGDGELPFLPIVCFGENTANPHAIPSDRALQVGNLVLIDWGASVRGYFSDLTRVFAAGDVDDELQRIAATVEEANGAARDLAGPDVPASDVDRAARQVIEKAGYGEAFVHRTGHGLGLEAHEEPYIRDGNQQTLAEGMTFTIEPGIYLAGRGGVRIEDDMVVTASGAESLSTLPRSLSQVAG